MPKIGKVYLVGAGPGGEELLTRKAGRLIENAGVVVYDRLISSEIMDIIPPGAVKINVGKNVGNHPVPQSEINQILVDQALAGHEVIRLKGGDSFLFGRGGEELEALAENGIEFEVVPGITSPLGAAAYAGIPLTHRDYCSSLHLITGHKRKDLPLELDYPSLVKLSGTLVFMMSVAAAGEIAEGLMAHGMDRDMPCAIVENGTRPNQRKFVGTLDGIEAMVRENGIVSPAVIIVGKVCSLSGRSDWFSALPLTGKKILVTRPREKAGRLAAQLKSLGAWVCQIPAVRTKALDFTAPELSGYTVLVFTSAVAVRCFFAGLMEKNMDARSLHGAAVFAVGEETAAALLHHGIAADFIPGRYSGESLALEALSKGLIKKTDRLLLIKARQASPDMPQIFKEKGISFEELTVYETVKETGCPVNPGEYDIITFTSVSCVEGMADRCKEQQLAGITALCIGEQTARAAGKYNMHVVISEEATIEAMVNKAKEISTGTKEEVPC